MTVSSGASGVYVRMNSDRAITPYPFSPHEGRAKTVGGKNNKETQKHGFVEDVMSSIESRPQVIHNVILTIQIGLHL
jgi:hypothetical protein